jgi:MHS family shikimate/dehydroshikimate transporter-like MFS transporter
MEAVDIAGGAAVNVDARSVKSVALASLIGTTVEWYDFFLYGTITGLVFDKLFFPTGNAFVSTMLAYTVYAVGFVTRPLGGVIFGHFGDRFGRKPLLVLTLSIMGVSTFLIGLLPTYASIGIWAPACLLVLRLLQGIGLGGEWGGAVLMAFEYAPRKHRGLYASYPQIGLAIGLCLSSGVVAALTTWLTPEAFLQWGWRAAFMASILLVAVGMFIRLRVVETPAFTKIRDTHAVAKVPAREVFADYRGNVFLGWGARYIDGVCAELPDRHPALREVGDPRGRHACRTGADVHDSRRVTPVGPDRPPQGVRLGRAGLRPERMAGFCGLSLLEQSRCRDRHHRDRARCDLRVRLRPRGCAVLRTVRYTGAL